VSKENEVNTKEITNENTEVEQAKCSELEVYDSHINTTTLEDALVKVKHQSKLIQSQNEHISDLRNQVETLNKSSDHLQTLLERQMTFNESLIREKQQIFQPNKLFAENKETVLPSNLTS